MFILDYQNPQEKLTKLGQVFDYLQKSSAPCGIIHNSTHNVIWRNSSSLDLMRRWGKQFPLFRTVTTTIKTQESEKMRQLRREVEKLACVESLPSISFLEKEYELFFEGIGVITVKDKFYKLKLGTTFRIFENVWCGIPRNKCFYRN